MGEGYVRRIDRYFVDTWRPHEENLLEILDDVCGDDSTIPVRARLGAGRRERWVVKASFHGRDFQHPDEIIELHAGDEVVVLGLLRSFRSWRVVDAACRLGWGCKV
jgi:hypothetical protein